MSAVKQAIANWYAVSEKYVRFGASDTEPRAEFAVMLRDMLDGEDPGVPDRWYLFDDMKGADWAAMELSKAAQQVIDAIKADPADLKDAYAYYFGSY